MEKLKRKTPSFWVHPFLIKRSDHDIEINILKDLDLGSGSNFKIFTRMHVGEFEVLALVPQTKEKWCKLAEMWEFPHALDAIDGKHIRTKALSNSGSNFYFYKGHFSIILFAIFDSYEKFLFIDVGSNGHINDRTIYKDSSCYDPLTKGILDIPLPAKLSEQEIETSFFFIGDDAFPFSQHLLKPFNRNVPLSDSEKVFNYRLCRARMAVECAFGRLVTRFKIFHRLIERSLDTTDFIVKASCALHNFLTRESFNVLEAIEICVHEHNYIDPIDVQFVEYNKMDVSTRQNIVKYVMLDGAIENQWKHIDK